MNLLNYFSSNHLKSSIFLIQFLIIKECFVYCNYELIGRTSAQLSGSSQVSADKVPKYAVLHGNAIKCQNEGQFVKVSDISDDPCISCKCINKEIVCQRQLCHTTKEEDSICKITNNLTQFYTFDGRQYEFNGKCNYILSRDCKSRSFSIHIVNKHQNETIGFDNKNNTIFGGTSVMIKIDSLKVRLGPSGRVSVGRTRVKLPHIRLGILSIVNISDKVVVRANIGLKVIWQSPKSIDIIIPPEFKYRTCGLCGNYNNNPNDDFITKKGKIYTEVEKFAHSWKVGKNLICESALHSTRFIRNQMRCTFNDWEQRYNALNICNVLKSSLFRQCHTAISIKPFFGKCMSDVCSCHKTKICHCNAIQSYANQCQRLGFYSQHWKKKTLCEAMKCPTGSVFSTCTSLCKRTCHNSNITQNQCRKRKCKPGCECPIGQVWHNHKCIYKQLCPKQLNSTENSMETFNENFLKDESVLIN